MSERVFTYRGPNMSSRVGSHRWSIRASFVGIWNRVEAGSKNMGTLAAVELMAQPLWYDAYFCRLLGFRH
ncbi:hypothetical protein, partial [Thiolapillus sp.]|uniref:hypothetical protein n=1 Tax=Thiolapillus sp. TaxID=2017437 RepID=UPI003AF954C6